MKKSKSVKPASVAEVGEIGGDISRGAAISPEPTIEPHCTFCGKSSVFVELLISTPDRKAAHICNECVDVASSILEDQRTLKELGPDWTQDELRKFTLLLGIETAPNIEYPQTLRLNIPDDDFIRRAVNILPLGSEPIEAPDETPHRDPEASPPERVPAQKTGRTLA